MILNVLLRAAKAASLLILALSFSSIAVTASAQASETGHSLEDYARHSQFLQVQISPNGKHLAATTRSNEGVIRLTVIDIANGEVLSASEGRDGESVNQFYWVNDDWLLLTMARETGALAQPSPTGELFSMSADGSRRNVLTGPRSRDGDYVIASLVDLLPAEPNNVLIYTYSYREREPFLDLYRMRIETGRKRREGRIPVRSTRGQQVQIITDNTGFPRIAVGIDPENDNDVITMVRDQGETRWTELSRRGTDDGGFSPLAFTSQDNLVAGLSRSQSDTSAIALFDLDTGEEEIIAMHPGTDLSPVLSIEQGRPNELIGATYEFGDIEAVLFDGINSEEFADGFARLVQAFPNRSVNITSATRDNSQFVVRVASANHPPRFYLYEPQDNQLSELAAGNPWIDENKLPETQAITYQSRDGKTIHALLTLPRGTEASDLPLVLLPHGGPIGVRDTYSRIDPDAKVLAEHGYAVLQPNFRGSGGFGAEFLQAGYRTWGTAMIDDMTDGVMHLVNEGIADKNRVCAYGASYGGYASVMSAIREPELYKCVIGFVGVYDLNMLFESGDIPGRRTGVNYLNRALPETREGRAAQSPLHLAADIQAPVFLIHGEQDQRAPVEHSIKLKEALEARDHPVEWMLKENEGHGFYDPENNVERWQRMLQFLGQHIGES